MWNVAPLTGVWTEIRNHIEFFYSKGRGCILDNELILYGSKVTVSHLNYSNVKCYLSTYKNASVFSEVYKTMPDFWEHPCKSIENYIDGKRNNKARYLITEKKSSRGVGYIELDYENPEMPEVGIAILGEYRARGYATEAARILLAHIFENESIECIIWIAFRSNDASCRIAEKLGGNIIKRKNLLQEPMCATGLKMNSADDEELLMMVTYEIKKVVFMNRLV